VAGTGSSERVQTRSSAAPVGVTSSKVRRSSSPSCRPAGAGWRGQGLASRRAHSGSCRCRQAAAARDAAHAELVERETGTNDIGDRVPGADLMEMDGLRCFAVDGRLRSASD
jgi:hypothetical protein